MSEQYSIVIEIKTADGILEAGSFYVGTDRDYALTIFDTLIGNRDIPEDMALRMHLRATESRGKGMQLKSLSCTLNQYTENCRIITRDIFKFFALEKA